MGKDNNNSEVTNPSHIGIINPFRYRSYYYDNETKLYYLNSRYYNPEWGRFINADSIIGNPNEMVDYNLYSYVNNNPIKHYDNDGKFGITITAAFLAKLALGAIVSLSVYVGAKTTADAIFGGGISLPKPHYSNSKSTTKNNEQEKVKDKTKEMVKDKVFNYSSSSKPCWEAQLNATKTDVELGNKITILESIYRVETGKDVMCDTRFNAQRVASAFPQAYEHPSHKNSHGFYSHYHPFDWSHIHIWYFN